MCVRLDNSKWPPEAKKKLKTYENGMNHVLNLKGKHLKQISQHRKKITVDTLFLYEIKMPESKMATNI